MNRTQKNDDENEEGCKDFEGCKMYTKDGRSPKEWYSEPRKTVCKQDVFVEEEGK
jgi:hypothetical protein